MTIPPIHSSTVGGGAFRGAPLTAPIATGVPPLVGDRPHGIPHTGVPHTGTPGAPGTPGATSPGTAAPHQDAPIALAGRLENGHVLPDATALALSLETATRSLLNGRPEQVLADLDAVWSNQLTTDSPWYLRAAALQLLGRGGDAEQVLRDAIARLPRSAAMLYLLGVHAAAKNQPEAARLASDHALALHPNEPLLLLQRAALLHPEAAASLLRQVQTMAPSLPSDQWLAALSGLGRGATMSRKTPLEMRAVRRLTPYSSAAIADEATQLPHQSMVPEGAPALDSAVRYGLTLLDSPTQSARSATGSSASIDPAVQYNAQMTAAQPAPAKTPEFPAWETLVIAGGVIAAIAVPELRVPSMLVIGAVAGLLMSRRPR